MGSTRQSAKWLDKRDSSVIQRKEKWISRKEVWVLAHVLCIWNHCLSENQALIYGRGQNHWVPRRGGIE